MGTMTKLLLLLMCSKTLGKITAHDLKVAKTLDIASPGVYVAAWPLLPPTEVRNLQTTTSTPERNLECQATVDGFECSETISIASRSSGSVATIAVVSTRCTTDRTDFNLVQAALSGTCTSTAQVTTPSGASGICTSHICQYGRQFPYSIDCSDNPNVNIELDTDCRLVDCQASCQGGCIESCAESKNNGANCPFCQTDDYVDSRCQILPTDENSDDDVIRCDLTRTLMAFDSTAVAETRITCPASILDSFVFPGTEAQGCTCEVMNVSFPSDNSRQATSLCTCRLCDAGFGSTMVTLDCSGNVENPNIYGNCQSLDCQAKCNGPCTESSVCQSAGNGAPVCDACPVLTGQDQPQPLPTGCMYNPDSTSFDCEFDYLLRGHLSAQITTSCPNKALLEDDFAFPGTPSCTCLAQIEFEDSTIPSTACPCHICDFADANRVSLDCSDLQMSGSLSPTASCKSLDCNTQCNGPCVGSCESLDTNDQGLCSLCGDNDMSQLPPGCNFISESTTTDGMFSCGRILSYSTSGGGPVARVDLTVTCPTNALLGLSEFELPGKPGDGCTCTAQLLNSDDGTAADCSCSVCGIGDQDYSIDCGETPILNACTSFDCSAQCNGECVSDCIESSEACPLCPEQEAPTTAPSQPVDASLPVDTPLPGTTTTTTIVAPEDTTTVTMTEPEATTTMASQVTTSVAVPAIYDGGSLQTTSPTGSPGIATGAASSTSSSPRIQGWLPLISSFAMLLDFLLLA